MVYQDFHGEVLIAGISDLPLHGLAGDKGLAFEIDAEPTAEFCGIRHRPPNPRAGRLDQNLSLDAIGRCVHVQPPGCILNATDYKCNLMVAYMPVMLPYRPLA